MVSGGNGASQRLFHARMQLAGTSTSPFYPRGDRGEAPELDAHGGSSYGRAGDVSYTIQEGGSTNYTFVWLANYANYHLTGFKDQYNNYYRELCLYPSYNDDIKKLLDATHNQYYAKLVLFSDVNTTMTPVYDYLSEGSYMYELLWGQR